MKVLLVSSGLPPSGQWGTEFYTLELAEGLARRGHEVSVLCPVTDGSRPRYTIEESERGSLRVFRVHNASRGGRALADSYEDPHLEMLFDQLIDRLRPDVCHFLHLLWSLSARLPLVARARGVGSVVTLTDFGLLCHRGQLFDWRLENCGGPTSAEACARCIREPSRFDAAAPAVFLKRWLVRAGALVGGLGYVVTAADVERRASRIAESLSAVGALIAPTRALSSVFRNAGVGGDQLVHVPYALDERRFEAARRTAPAHPRRIAFLGQFAPHKGPATLLAAVRILEHRLPESVEPWEVCFWGDASPGRHARYPARLFGGQLGPRVQVARPFTAARLPAVLSELSAVVVPSEWMENAPFVALQARAAGVPVVASDVPGLREVIEPGVHGLLFPPGDAEALADALGEVIAGRLPRLLNIDWPFDSEQHVRRLEELYAASAEREVVGAR